MSGVVPSTATSPDSCAQTMSAPDSARAVKASDERTLWPKTTIVMAAALFGGIIDSAPAASTSDVRPPERAPLDKAGGPGRLEASSRQASIKAGSPKTSIQPISQGSGLATSTRIL